LGLGHNGEQQAARQRGEKSVSHEKSKGGNNTSFKDAGYTPKVAALPTAPSKTSPPLCPATGSK
jgi:hypothetical protein